MSTRSKSPYDKLILSIESFFDYASPAQHEKTARSMLRAVQKNSIWKKRDPASLLEFIEALENVISSLNDFLKSLKTSKKGVVFPQMAIKEEILDGFRHFFKFQQYSVWRKQLRLMLHFALSSTSHLSLGVEIDLLGTYIQLNSLFRHCADLLGKAADKPV